MTNLLPKNLMFLKEGKLENIPSSMPWNSLQRYRLTMDQDSKIL